MHPQDSEQIETSVKAYTEQDIKEMKEQVSTKDKVSGVKLLLKLDTKYLMELAKEGSTEENKAKVKAYLKERLNSEEYEQAKDLIMKYIELLDK